MVTSSDLYILSLRREIFLFSEDTCTYPQFEVCGPFQISPDSKELIRPLYMPAALDSWDGKLAICGQKTSMGKEQLREHLMKDQDMMFSEKEQKRVQG